MFPVRHERHRLVELTAIVRALAWLAQFPVEGVAQVRPAAVASADGSDRRRINLAVSFAFDWFNTQDQSALYIIPQNRNA